MVANQNRRDAWIGLGKFWRTAHWLILALWVTHLVGETIATQAITISENDWIGLWQTLIGVNVSQATG